MFSNMSVLASGTWYVVLHNEMAIFAEEVVNSAIARWKTIMLAQLFPGSGARELLRAWKRIRIDRGFEQAEERWRSE